MYIELSMDWYIICWIRNIIPIIYPYIFWLALMIITKRLIAILIAWLRNNKIFTNASSLIGLVLVGCPGEILIRQLFQGVV